MVGLVHCPTDHTHIYIYTYITYIYIYIYILFGISASISTVSELLCGKHIKTFVILSAILLSIKSPVASAVF